jgi:hypothetical protein
VNLGAKYNFGTIFYMAQTQMSKQISKEAIHFETINMNF